MMNALGRVAAQRLDRIGLRWLVAQLATLAYRLRGGSQRRFSVTPRGQWVNQQKEATIVSPTIHTSPLEVLEQKALDQWAFNYLPREGDTIIDVGAGVGEETIIFSRLVGRNGKVISIEANPSTFACLCETVRRSGAANVSTLCLAVTDHDGEAIIEDADDHISNSILAGTGTICVPSRCLDSLLAELSLAEVDLLKMNIEGAEKLAIRRIAHIARSVKNVVISCHDFIAERGGSEDFRTFDCVRVCLEEAGFETVTRPNHPDDWIRYYIYGRNTALGEQAGENRDNAANNPTLKR